MSKVVAVAVVDVVLKKVVVAVHSLRLLVVVVLQVVGVVYYEVVAIMHAYCTEYLYYVLQLYSKSAVTDDNRPLYKQTMKNLYHVEHKKNHAHYHLRIPILYVTCIYNVKIRNRRFNRKCNKKL